MRTAALTTVIAATALAAAACSSTQPGRASPTSDQTAASSASPSPSSGATNDLVGLNACTLLTDDEAQQAVPGAGTHTDQGDAGGAGTSDCEWGKIPTNGLGGATFGVTVRPSAGLDEVVVKPGAVRSDTTSTVSPHRQIALVKGGGAGYNCVAAIAVGTGRVDISSTTLNGSIDDMCAIVSKIDDYVEPRLPAS